MTKEKLLSCCWRDRGATDIRALFEAVNRRLVHTVKLLLDRGFDIEGLDEEHEEYEDKTVLLLAVECQNQEIIKLLLDYGAQINRNLPHDRWRYVLHCAVEIGNKEIVQLLLNRGADMNLEDKGKTALTIAINCENDELSKFLVGQMILMMSQKDWK